jgi:integrase
MHELPLSPAARAILEARTGSMGPTDLLFPTSESRPFTNWDPLLRRIRQKIGEGAEGKANRFSLHDIRRAFVSALAERGHDVDLLDQVLSHVRRGTLGVYQRASRMAERDRALRAWANLITETEPETIIVPFQQRR